MRFKFFIFYFFLLVLFFLIPFGSAFHFVYGKVLDAKDGTLANDLEVILWNPLNGVSDNLTDIIGPNGNSYTDNYYSIDCENLLNPCVLGDNLSIKVIDKGDGYTSSVVNITITGSGFDQPGDLKLNSLPVFSGMVVDDSFTIVPNEIDLLAGSTREVFCSSVIEELDGENLTIYSAEFFDSSYSFPGQSDDNNYHYTNSSCILNQSYGTENQTFVNCSFQVQYYANASNWECRINASDPINNQTGIDYTTVNSLLSLEVGPSIDYGDVLVGNISSEFELVVSNMGNVQIDLGLSGYGLVLGDNHSMVCDYGAKQNISLEDERFNLTQSNPGSLTEMDFRNFYSPLTNSSTTFQFDLDFRINDFLNDANKSTYWRIYAPSGVFGNCTGNIVFGAVAS